MVTYFSEFILPVIIRMDSKPDGNMTPHTINPGDLKDFLDLKYLIPLFLEV